MAGMTDAIRPESFPKIRGARRFYTIAAWVTGVLLLLLVAEMILKYGFHLEVELGGPFGAVALTQEGQLTGFNLSRWILIIHGWFYVVYLIAAYRLWLLMRWGLGWLLAMAGGGVVPFLSFITEHFLGGKADRELASAERAHAQRTAEDAELAEVESSLDDEERARLDAEVRAEAEARARGAETSR